MIIIIIDKPLNSLNLNKAVSGSIILLFILILFKQYN